MRLFLAFLKLPIDYVALVLAGVSAYVLRFTPWAIELKPVEFTLPFGEYLGVVLLVAFAWLVVFVLAGLYSTNPNRKFSGELTRVFLACSTGLALVAIYLLFTVQQFDSRFLVAVSWVLSIVYVVVGRFFIRGLQALLFRMGIGLRKAVVIGGEDVASVIVATLKERRELGYRIVATFPTFTSKEAGAIDELGIDELIFTNPRANEVEALAAIEFCQEKHITFKYSADLFATFGTNMSVEALAGVPVVELRRTRLVGWGRILKRIFDIVFSIVVIVITSPLMVLAGVAVALESGFPILYKNERVGKFGRHFKTFKFRSMKKEYSTGLGNAKAEAFEKDLIAKQNTKRGPVYKIANDPRVTRVGKFIRRWSIDELPQFFNVLLGSMSIVGPRPHQPREVEQYKKEHKHVLHIKPGITGMAQISGRSDLTFEEEIRLDVLYIEKWSLLQDVIIFLKTPFILFRKRKAL